MATMPRYPSLFQINTRVWLQRLSREAGKPITLADIDDATIDSFAERGFDWIWLLSVWQIGSAGRAVSRGNPQWRSEFQAVLPDLTEDEIFQRTWGLTPEPFWPKAIPAVRARYPAFNFMAEVYWDLEWELQQQGFAYCYDKRLYDRLRDGHATPIRGHLLAGLDYQDKLSRFLENH